MLEAKILKGCGKGDRPTTQGKTLIIVAKKTQYLNSAAKPKMDSTKN